MDSLKYQMTLYQYWFYCRSGTTSSSYLIRQKSKFVPRAQLLKNGCNYRVIEACQDHLDGWRGVYNNLYAYDIWNQEDRGYWVSSNAIALTLSLIHRIVSNHGCVLRP